MTADPITAEVHVEAPPERVFDYFTQPEKMLRWMGDWAALTPEPDGEFSVDVGGVAVRGRYLELDPPKRLLISWGHEGSDRLPPGSSRLEIVLTPDARGTRVEIVHSGLPDPESVEHRRGWGHFLARLAGELGH
jgi:uncharacterized protein YndB with AHSA1/START domain